MEGIYKYWSEQSPNRETFREKQKAFGLAHGINVTTVLVDFAKKSNIINTASRKPISPTYIYQFRTESNKLNSTTNVTDKELRNLVH